MEDNTYPALAGYMSALLTVMDSPLGKLKDEVENLEKRAVIKDPIIMSYFDNINKYIGQIEKLQKEGVEKWQKFHN